MGSEDTSSPTLEETTHDRFSHSCCARPSRRFSPLLLRAADSEKDKPADEAMKLAVKLTEEGAATFDTFNAKAMADYYSTMPRSP